MSVAVISIHDVAPATFARSREWLERVEAHGLRATLLVVPGPWGSDGLEHHDDVVAWLHDVAARGHELSLHGWEHRAVVDPVWAPTSRRGQLRSAYGRLLARGCAEFHDLGRDEAARRLRLGVAVMARCGIEPVGFTPPGWLSSPPARSVMADMGFAYTTSQWTVFDLRTDRRVRIPAVSQRPGSALAGIGATLNRVFVRHRARRSASVRLALHPNDLHHRSLVDATEQMLADLAAAQRRGSLDVVTYAELVGGATPSSRRMVSV